MPDCSVTVTPKLTAKPSSEAGFTLIELSIVLVIAGLLAGGILVGQDLVRAAAERAQIAQIEKYNTAVNTFYGKYGALPGDLGQDIATQFGFLSSPSRHSCNGGQGGDGDNNGLIQGTNCGGAVGGVLQSGEALMFWNDLSFAGLIEGGFKGCSDPQCSVVIGNTISLTTTPSINAFIPQAKIGNNNYVYVYSGGYTYSGDAAGDSKNYFGLSALPGIIPQGGGDSSNVQSNPGMTVKQAYDIDLKMDDGLPQSGRILAIYLNEPIERTSATWANGSGQEGLRHNTIGGYCGFTGSSGVLPVGLCGVDDADNATTGQNTGSPTTCYDVGAGNTVPATYSLGGNASPNNASRVNCALSIRFQ